MRRRGAKEFAFFLIKKLLLKNDHDLAHIDK
jgi:hypothetical protein